MKLDFLFSDMLQRNLAYYSGYIGYFINERFEPGNPSVIRHSLPQISDCHRSGMPAFEVPFIEVDVRGDSHFEWFAHTIRPAYKETVFSGESTVRMFIHPDIVGHPVLHRRAFGGSVRAVPLAGSRTVVLEQDPSVHIKLSTNGLYVGKYVRSIGLRELDQANVIGGIFQALKNQGAFPEFFDYMPECLGCAIYDAETPAHDPVFRLLNSQDAHVVGCLMRDSCLSDNARVRVPLFSLYSKDRQHREDPEFLVQLIHASGKDPVDFLMAEVIDKILRVFLHFAFKYGLLLEMHGQNVWIELDRGTGRIVRILIQDMESIKSDYPYQQELGLDPALFKPVSNNADNDEQAWSLSYDHRISTQVFAKIARLIEKTFGISRAAVQGRVREAFVQICREMQVDPDRKLPPGYSWHQKTGMVFLDKVTEYEKWTLPLWR